MPICPKCKEWIDHLKGYEQQGYNLDLIDGELVEGEHFYLEDSFQAECPECAEVLFTDIEEAKEFLRGG